MGRLGEATYTYHNCAFFESADSPDDVAARWAGHANSGIAPHGPYRNIFEHPEEWPPVSAPIEGTWVSHWQPILSIGRQDL